MSKPASQNVNRRLLLGGLLPVALGAAAIPAVAAPETMSAQERATFHLKEFMQAMGELSANDLGWLIAGGQSGRDGSRTFGNVAISKLVQKPLGYGRNPSRLVEVEKQHLLFELRKCEGREA